MGNKNRGGGGGGDQKGLLWRLPEVTSKELGKIGPGLGIGIGCGAGAGLGFFGGAGLGYGFPGLTLGFGVGAGCGVGIGFGYGLGKGIAYDENKRYSNVGKMFQEAPHLPTSFMSKTWSLWASARTQCYHVIKKEALSHHERRRSSIKDTCFHVPTKSKHPRLLRFEALPFVIICSLARRSPSFSKA